MKSLLTIAVIGAVALSSCSVYREGQTPDDVYYSPARENKAAAGGYVQANSGRNDGRRYQERPTYSAYDDYATMDDRWLMMRVRNPHRWSLFDNYNYYSPYSYYSPFNSPFNFHSPYTSMGYGFSPGWSFGLGFGSYNPYGFGFNNFYNNHWNWNSYYNPYYSHVVVVNPKTNPAGYTKARSFNLNRYNNNYNTGRSTLTPRYNNSNLNRARYNNSNNSTLGNSFRRVFSNSNNSNGNDYNRGTYTAPRSQDRPVRTYTPPVNNTPSYNRSSGGGGTSGGSSGSRPSRR